MSAHNVPCAQCRYEAAIVLLNAVQDEPSVSQGITVWASRAVIDLGAVPQLGDMSGVSSGLALASCSYKS